MDLKDIYNQLILHHYKNPYNEGSLPTDAYSISSSNNNCGDSVSLYFTINESKKRIEQVSFEAKGCVICKASASILMKTVEGKELADILEIISTLKEFLSKDRISENGVENNEEPAYRALSYINKFPTRKQCVLLSWEALEKKIEELAS